MHLENATSSFWTFSVKSRAHCVFSLHSKDLGIRTAFLSNLLSIHSLYSTYPNMSLDESHSSQDPDNSRPLLFKEDDEEQRYHSYPPKRKQGFRWNWAFILHGSAFAIYTIIFLAGSSLAVTKGCHRDLVYCKSPHLNPISNYKLT